MLYFINIISLCESVKKSDWISKNDLFVTLEIGDEKRRTTVIWNDNNPIWNESFIFNILDNDSNELTLTIYDEDSYSKSEKIVSEKININMGDLVDEKTKHLNIKHGLLGLKEQLENDNLKRINQQLEREKKHNDKYKMKIKDEMIEIENKIINCNSENNILRSENEKIHKIIKNNTHVIESVTSNLLMLNKEYQNCVNSLKTIFN